LGISTPEQVREILGYADGAIVGSALVKALSEGGVEAVAQLGQELAAGATDIRPAA
jgi:tryptophan synthase alpha chain